MSVNLHMSTQLQALGALDKLRQGNPEYSYKVALSRDAVCAGLNRYFNVLPCACLLTDDRALLPGAYINASLIAPLGTHSYVATQAPLPHTYINFFRHIVASGADTIVNLTPLVEHGIQKSDPYWTAGDLGDGWSVTIQRECGSNIPGLKTRTLLIATPESTHSVAQLHFEGWPDHGVISPTTIIALADAVGAARTSDPVWVHCSAGIGRSGTLIGALLAQEHDDRSVPPHKMAASIVAHMREFRAGMVQTPEQFNALVDTIAALRAL